MTAAVNASPDLPPAMLGISHKWWVVASVLPILLLLGTSSTILDIPRPVVVDELGSDRYRFQWVTGATLVGTLIGMAMIRWLRDRIGLKNIHITGIIVFAVAGLFCGSAQTGEALAISRFIEGFGKGLSVATVLALFYREFPQRKDLAMALYGVGIYFGKAIAPPLSGYLTDYPSWRWIFYLNAPAGLLFALLAWWILLPDRPEEASREPFDFPGLALLMLWITPLLVVLFRGQKWGWQTSNEILLMEAAIILALFAFVIRELRTPYPLIDLRLFRRRTFALAECIKSLFAANFYTVISLLSGYMVVLRAYPRTTSGLVFLPGALAMGLSLVLSALLFGRIDRKLRLLVGLAGMAWGTWLFADIDLYTDKRWLAAVFALWGTGAGLVVSPVICIPLEGLTQSQVVSSASIKNMVRSLPGALGGLWIGTLLTRRADGYFDTLRQQILPNRPVVETVTARLQEHLAFHGGSPVSDQSQHVIGRYLHANASAFAYQTAMQYLALGCVVAIVLTLFIPTKK